MKKKVMEIHVPEEDPSEKTINKELAETARDNNDEGNSEKNIDKNNDNKEDNNVTCFLGAAEPDRGDFTIGMWDSRPMFNVLLTDINNSAKSFRVPISTSITIGRTKGDVIIDYEKSVSSQHCRITLSDGNFFITDLQSTNGTYIDNRRIEQEEEIYSGCTIKFGRAELRFEVQ